jgi:S-adenosylmethionine:tRNA ribosyltransferase-isomerase
MHSKDVSIAGFTYTLPDTAIAYYPLAERDASKLLVYRAGKISDTVYRNIADELGEEAVLVFNNTRVVEARIVFQKPSGGKVEIFCLEPPPEYQGMAAAMAQTGAVRWNCLIGGASKWKAGQVLVKRIGPGEGDGAANDITLEARYVEKLGDTFLIELSWKPAELSFAELLHRAGSIPLPPYIHRAPDSSDTERYQTVYAQYEGSVAAPTAGLHFTDRVLRELEEKGIGRLFVTLHVGAGTFLPVKAATLGGHVMHMEFISVTREAIEGLLQAGKAGKRVIAVGTTSARTIESLYWLGLKTLAAPGIGLSELAVKQWDAYEIAGDAAPEAALTALLDWMGGQGSTQLVTTTQLLITPGYEWKLVKGLITNFHQPESTLLLLVASLIGEDWRKVYTYALEKGFRFLSYGDGCLLLPP